jgi:hypothetical protein
MRARCRQHLSDSGFSGSDPAGQADFQQADLRLNHFLR